jgi:hypothetical protein
MTTRPIEPIEVEYTIAFAIHHNGFADDDLRTTLLTFFELLSDDGLDRLVLGKKITRDDTAETLTADEDTLDLINEVIDGAPERRRRFSEMLDAQPDHLSDSEPSGS